MRLENGLQIKGQIRPYNTTHAEERFWPLAPRDARVPRLNSDPGVHKGTPQFQSRRL